MVNETRREGKPVGGPTPMQLMHRLLKKYEHVEPEERRILVIDELRQQGLPRDVVDRLLREYE